MIVEKELKKYLIERFFHGASDRVKDDEPLFESGIIDSLGVLQLVSFIEDRFGIHVEDEDLVPENFDTIKRIVEFVENKRLSNQKI